MAESPTVELPDEIRDLLAEREQLYRRRDRAANDAERLRAVPAPDEGVRSQESGVGEARVPTSLSPLTAEQTPPAELAAALAQLEPSLAEMERIERTIDEQRTSLESLKHGATRMLTIAVAGVLLLLLLLAIVVSTR